MAAYSTYAALLPLLREAWMLSNSEAGLVGGALFAGYMAAVPVATGITDRVDARRVYLVAALLGAAGALGFALLARGLWSAFACNALIGAGLAGTYMPGLKALSDRIEGPLQSRSVAFYTSTFAIGATFSLFIAGFAEPQLGWRWTFAISALSPVAAGLIVIFGLPPRPAHHAAASRALIDFRPVFRNRAALGFVLGYAAHCWELFGSRSWMVAFFAFVATQPGGAMPWSAVALTAVINLLGPPASIAGNEIAVRVGRRRFILRVMVVSAALGCLVGFSAALPWYVAVAAMSLYTVTTLMDSAALTAGVIAASEPGNRGATMAVHSLLGFGAAALAPVVFGMVLDAAGGETSLKSWGLAFASLGIGCALAPLVVAWTSRRTR